MPNITNPVLPPADSPSLVLAHPTAIEKRHIDTITGEAWKGRLTTEGYIRRVQHLQEQSLTRGGGLVVWVLVDTADIPPTAAAPRRILASCEIFRRRALIKSRSGEVEEVTSHSIGTVFCEAQYRRRGYTRRMMSELGKQLDTQQKDQRSKASFSVLYSDVGKKFYSATGWRPFPSSHISLSPVTGSENKIPDDIPSASPLHASDLSSLCQEDVNLLRAQLKSNTQDHTIVALVADEMTLKWHHAREEFIAMELLGRDPDIKGSHAVYYDDPSQRIAKHVWCTWARRFGDVESEDTLYILRMVVPDDDHKLASDASRTSGSAAHLKPCVLAIAAVLEAARHEAAIWGMSSVVAWNPTQSVLDAARLIDPSVHIIEREDESIASLRWHGSETEERERQVEWVANERFGWC